MTNFIDVAVIGAGPAGALAAITLAEKGFDTHLFERERLPRNKVCAGGLVKRAADALPKDLAYPVQSICDTFELRSLSAGISLSEKRENLIRMVSRKDFDYALIEYAKGKGVEIHPEEEVVALTPSTEFVALETKAQHYSTSYVVLAEGANSRLANGFWGEQPKAVPSLEADILTSPETIARFANRAIFDLDVVRKGYGWVFPKGSHLSVGLVSFQTGKADLPGSFGKYLKMLELGDEIEITNKRGFIIPVTPRRNGFMKDRMILVGDAAGFADPISAEGLSNAIMSGIACGESVGKNYDDPVGVGREYQRRIEGLFLKDLHVGGKLSDPFYSFPRLRNVLLRHYGDALCKAMCDVLEGKRTIHGLPSPLRILRHLLKLG